MRPDLNPSKTVKETAARTAQAAAGRLVVARVGELFRMTEQLTMKETA